MCEVRDEALDVCHRHGRNLTRDFPVPLEAVVLKHLHALLCPLVADKVHKGVAHIHHGALIEGDIKEVKRPGKAQVVQLEDQLSLRVAVGDVADHQRSWRALALRILIFHSEVHVPWYVPVEVLPQHWSHLLSPMHGAFLVVLGRYRLYWREATRLYRRLDRLLFDSQIELHVRTVLRLINRAFRTRSDGRALNRIALHRA
mmetsp:Transcript_31470/g.68936  ORF Transcript_31470/g.68936 Transcript_31470/m.68936 type:complete len:201 (-) Transcript_31470:420-1022(-)